MFMCEMGKVEVACLWQANTLVILPVTSFFEVISNSTFFFQIGTQIFDFGFQKHGKFYDQIM